MSILFLSLCRNYLTQLKKRRLIMDNKEKQVLVTLFSMILIFLLYSLYVYNTFVVDNFEIINSVKFWGKTFLILIPVTIVAEIVIHIIFAIVNRIVTNEDIETKSDERDKLIELKALRISHWVFTVGFLLSMVSLVLEMPLYMMFLILISSGFLSGITSEIAKIYYYRNGF